MIQAVSHWLALNRESTRITDVYFCTEDDIKNLKTCFNGIFNTGNNGTTGFSNRYYD